ncbi:MAG TPA: M1 family aminopeptidase, partial [Longimicrobiales bacterium]|nr:M1 family aminopeptidase [Longimicrobiales bacterium]
QVVGATGVPVQGDPGWEGAAAPGSEPPRYQRDVYADRPTESLGLLSSPVAPGRKRVHWRAEKVHNFVWTTSPDYVYEGGQWNGISVHVLRRPDDADWAGTAVQNTITTLQWLTRIFGPFAWPQITNVHRLDGGGTEFPMMIMDGSPGLGLILHELGHNYTMGYMANNEWREGFLDEGLTSFQTAWYFQTHGQPDTWAPTFESVATFERSGQCPQPITTESADFMDPACYSVMTYSKPSVVYRMLQAYLGEDVLRRGLQTYYEDNRFRHVTLEDFQGAMEKASGQDLDWFFDQWFRSVARLDYAIQSAETRRQADGTWRTRLQVVRHGAAWMPVTLQVGGERRVLRSRAPLQAVEVVSAARPEGALLDPDGVILDLNRANDRWRF